MLAPTRSLDGRTLMIALRFSVDGGHTDVPAEYVGGKVLINSQAGSRVSAPNSCFSRIRQWCWS